MQTRRNIRTALAKRSIKTMLVSMAIFVVTAAPAMAGASTTPL